jgi:hypothetical protein
MATPRIVCVGKAATSSYSQPVPWAIANKPAKKSQETAPGAQLVGSAQLPISDISG